MLYTRTRKKYIKFYLHVYGSRHYTTVNKTQITSCYSGSLFFDREGGIMYHDRFECLENILINNMEHRGLKEAFLKDELKKAAESLLDGDTIIIVTGFAIKDAAAGETDGPIGAVSLAGALEELGKKVVLITDGFSGNILKSCADARGVRSTIEIINHDISKLHAQKMIDIYKPSHIIAVERPGKAMDGNCYSMRGEDISDIVPIMDELFEEAKKVGITTIAIGDGGNEIGMGKISNLVMDLVPNGELICASFASDFLIVAGVSNWGAHALVAGLSILTGINLLHDINTEILMLQRMVEAGAVDGCTKKKTMTVDGISLEQNLNILMELKYAVQQKIRYIKNVCQ